jgi:PAS domain S-box-containing protein
MIYPRTNNTNARSHTLDPLNLQLHAVFDAVSDLVFCLSVETHEKFRYTFLNKAFLKETELHEAAILNHYANEVIPVASRQFVLEKYREAVLTKTSVTWKEKIIYPNGVKNGEVTVTPWIDDHGQCVHLIGCIRHTTPTESKTTLDDVYGLFEKKIVDDKTMHQTMQNKAAQEMLLLMNNTEESFVLIDINFRIVICNNQFQKHYLEYFNREVKKGDSILDYASTIRRKSAQQIYQKVFAGEMLETEIEIKVADNTVLTFFTRFKPAYDATGNMVGAFVTSVNITEQKRSQHQLIVNEKRYRALVENSNDAIVILTPQGKTLYASPSIEKVLGYTEQEIFNLDLFSLIHPNDLDEVQNKLKQAKANPGVPISGYLSHVLHKDGTWRWLENTITDMTHDPAIGGIVDNFRDITEKKKAENQLYYLQLKMDAAIRVAKLGYWEWDTKEDKITWSDRVYEIYDVDKDIPLSFSTVFNCVHPDDRLKYTEMVTQWSIEKKGGPLEYRVRRRDGSVRYVQSDREIVTNENGEVIKFTGSVLDVTEHKRAENQILLEKELSDSIINSLPGIFYLYTREGKFLRWNKNFETVTGYTPEEMGVINPLDFFDTDEKELITQKIENVFQHIEETVEANFLLKNRTKIPYYFTGRLITYQDEQCLLGVGIDISDKIQAHELLQKINSHLISAQQIARLGYWEVDLLNGSTYWSDEMYRICGIEKNKVITNVGTFLNLVHPDDKQLLLETNKAALKTSVASAVEFRIFHKDGSLRHLLGRVNRVPDAAGNPLRLEGTLQDITERKAYIQAIEDQNKKLKEIAWMQSHTVRAPLARIMGLVNLLNLMKNHPCTEMSKDEVANQIVHSANELDVIIRKIVRKTEQVENESSLENQ